MTIYIECRIFTGSREFSEEAELKPIYSDFIVQSGCLIYKRSSDRKAIRRLRRHSYNLAQRYNRVASTRHNLDRYLFHSDFNYYCNVREDEGSWKED